MCIRHVEELSLMESYQDLKREGTVTFLLVVWMIDLHNLIIPPRAHASHVLQVATRKRGRNAENPTGGRVG